ncbi:MAG: putative signal transducing protein [Acidimicrobiia bacterium]
MDLVRLGFYGSVTEANLVKARLESEGIEAVVQSDDLGATAPVLAATGVVVLVRSSDRPRAMEVLERMLSAGD